jgi:hypothetical protein
MANIGYIAEEQSISVCTIKDIVDSYLGPKCNDCIIAPGQDMYVAEKCIKESEIRDQYHNTLKEYRIDYKFNFCPECGHKIDWSKLYGR